MTKARDLKKELKGVNCRFVRQGGDHEIWRGPDGTPITIPRGRDINDRLADVIRKAAGIKS